MFPALGLSVLCSAGQGAMDSRVWECPFESPRSLESPLWYTCTQTAPPSQLDAADALAKSVPPGEEASFLCTYEHCPPCTLTSPFIFNADLKRSTSSIPLNLSEQDEQNKIRDLAFEASRNQSQRGVVLSIPQEPRRTFAASTRYLVPSAAPVRRRRARVNHARTPIEA